ncbi:MAG: adenosine deaminase [Proteobacteria bacterium]|nr:adenosine deaminase [Pseudomonadota bacterium]
MRNLVQCALVSLLFVASSSVRAEDNFAAWFESFKASASDRELHGFLYAMPKGGDLHQHLSGSIFSEWWWQLALQESEHGETFYTRVKIGHCHPVGDAANRGMNLMFETIAAYRYSTLSDCEQAKFRPLSELNTSEQMAWMNSIRLDHDSEGRDEFFERHWQRLGDLTANPWIRAEALALNVKAFAAEGLVYLEPQLTLMGYRDGKGRPIPPSEVAKVIRARLAEPDVQSTGVSLRFQQAILRFLPGAEADLAEAYRIVAAEPEWVGVNMVGREDDDRGYPLRFLKTFRALRERYSGIRLSIHAGEVDEPNYHVRDTLLLGAERIGHGLNLIDDPATLIDMRSGSFMIEINLISNLLLEYVADYREHPFPEYLRLGVPVSLSTDDRGMWDSTMTDEYFVAVREFDLHWHEIRLLLENSLQFSFMPAHEKKRHLEALTERLVDFERQWIGTTNESGWPVIESPKRGFVCRKYQLCQID